MMHMHKRIGKLEKKGEDSTIYNTQGTNQNLQRKTSVSKN